MEGANVARKRNGGGKAAIEEEIKQLKERIIEIELSQYECSKKLRYLEKFPEKNFRKVRKVQLKRFIEQREEAKFHLLEQLAYKRTTLRR